MRNFALQDLLKFQDTAHFFLIVPLKFGIEHFGHSHFALDHARDLIDVLRFNKSFDVVFKDLSEVILELGTTEVLQNFLPVWGILCATSEGDEWDKRYKTYIVSSQVGLELSSKYFERSTLPDTVGPNEAKDLTRARGREAMELERIGGIAMGHFRVEISRKVNDSDSFKWTPESLCQGKFPKTQLLLTF